jgi:hypothetical protein
MDLIRSLAISEGLRKTLKYTFAFATARERHLGWRYAAPAYLFSSYMALSRMPANRHWLSDAVFGSAVGIIARRTVHRP